MIFENLTILYVEDEQIVRETLSSMIGDIFKEFITAQNGQDGYEKYEENQDKIDLVITDINMPELNGFNMMKKINKINADIPFIVSSAYNDKKFFRNINEFEMQFLFINL